MSITDPFFQQHTVNTKEQKRHLLHEWKANVFITKTKPFTEQNIEKGKQLAWPCFTHPGWHYCSFSSYSLSIFPNESSHLELWNRKCDKNGEEESSFLQYNYYPLLPRLWYTHSSRYLLTQLRFPQNPSIKEKPEGQAVRFKPRDETCCYAGAINRALALHLSLCSALRTD